jgi:hypothetical protein
LKNRINELFEGSTPQLKVLAKITEAYGGLTEFVHDEIHQKRSRMNSDEAKEENVVRFSRRLFGDASGPKAVLVRECYRSFATQVHSMMFTKTVPTPSEVVKSVIAGTRRIGKSVFGVLMVFEFVDEGYAVLYDHKETRMLVVGSNLKPDQRKMLDSACLTNGYEKITQQGVYFFDHNMDSRLYSFLLSQNDIIHVLDLGDDHEGGVPRNGSTRRLVLSSPNASQLRLLHKTHAAMEILYMPVWTREELQPARESCFPNLTKDEVGEGFRKFGGVPRLVLEYGPENADNLFKHQVDKITVEGLYDVMCKASYYNIPKMEDTGCIIHVVPNGPSFRCIFATDYVCRVLVARFIKDSTFKTHEFASKIQGNKQFATLRGFMLEGLVHNLIPEGPELKFRLLTVTVPKKPSFNKIKLPSIAAIQFRDLASLPSILPNVYYHPESKIFQTIDAFCIIDGYLLNPKKYKKGQLILVLFQVTVSNKHKVDGPTVKRLHQEIFEKWKGSGTVRDIKLPKILVFVSPPAPNGILKFQPLTSSNGSEYVSQPPQLDQYVLILADSFQSMWENWPLQEEVVRVQ